MDHSKEKMIRALYRRDLGPVENARPKFKVGLRATARIVLGMLLLSELVVIKVFEKFVMMQQAIFAQGSRIEVEYARRRNLVPLLAEVSRSYARHERELMNYTADARALKKSADKVRRAVGPERAARMDKVFSKLIALSEQYPDLKADQSYQALMEKIVATENRVATAREKYVSLTNDYNRTVQTFPYATFARFLNFQEIGIYVPEKELAPSRNTRIFFNF